jgi:hypothetical protein
MSEMHPEWSIQIISRGRSGNLVYRESENALVCYWEFAGGDSLAFVSLPDAVPDWALDRLPTIMQNIADDLIRTQAPNHIAVIDEADRSITLKRPR